MGGSQCPEPEDQDCENDQLLVDPELVQDLVDPIKVLGLDGIHPRVLKRAV